ncbi:MAG: DUF3990 domain-containing protein [Lachnospiraceae bacterium]|nr:DUF3990 domain-containing protein [Lachnospiraceae bacterium]
MCDFGVGFYTASIEEYGLSNIVENEKEGSGFFYTIRADFEPLKVFSFDYDLDFWMLFTAYNRGYIEDIDSYSRLKKMIDDLMSFDVISGLVSDDRSAYAFGRFLDKATTNVCLKECIKFFNLGYQYVFRTVKACDHLEIMHEEQITGDRYFRIAHDRRVRIGRSQDIVSEIETKFRREGLYLDELLEEYR